jgi:hypothetical protein
MAVDLATHTLFQRQSLVLDTDSLVKLEHEWSRDRLRKILFDRVDHLVVWRVIPWVRVLLATLIFGLPGFLMMLLASDPVPTVVGAILLVIALVIDARYLYCRKTTLRIVRAGKTEDITGICRPAKVRRLVQAMVRNIHTVQAVATTPQPPAPPPPADDLPAADLGPVGGAGDITA